MPKQFTRAAADELTDLRERLDLGVESLQSVGTTLEAVKEDTEQIGGIKEDTAQIGDLVEGQQGVIEILDERL